MTRLPKTAVLLFVMVVMVCATVLASHTFKLRFTNQDDVYMGYVADRIRLEGVPAYLENAGMYAGWQGRAYFYLSFFFFILPFFFNSMLIRTALITAVQLASIGVMGGFLSLYLRAAGGMLFVALALCFLPQWVSVFPTNAHTIVYQMPVLLFFGGMWLYVAVTRRDLFPRRRTAASAIALLLLLLSLCFYETLVVPFFCIAAAVCWPENRSWRARFHALLPICAVFAVWAAVYLGFRITHKPWYEGADIAPFRPALLITKLSQNLAKSLPASNYLALPAPAIGSHTKLWFRYLKSNLSALGFLQAMALAGFLALAMKRLPSVERLRSRVAPILALTLASAIVIPIPMLLTTKYQNIAWDQIPYLPDYYSYLAFVAALTAAVLAICGGIRRGAVAWYAVAVLCAGITVTTAVANDYVVAQHEKYSNKWKMADTLCYSEVLHTLPSNAVLLAPSLWEHMNPAAWFFQGYWNRYFKIRTGRDLTFVRTVEEARQSAGDAPVYYCERQWLPGYDRSSILLTSPVRFDAGGGMNADSITIVTDRDLTDSTIDYRAVDSLLPQRVAVVPVTDRGGAFVASAQTPGLAVGSATLVGPAGAEKLLVSFPVSFGEGFSHLEQDEKHRWHWSDGPSGEGVLTIVNPTATPVRVLFRATLRTAALYGGVKTRFDFSLGRETITVDSVYSGVFEHAFTLQPGQNEVRIKCYGGRKYAPGDARYLVFGIQDWSVSTE